MTSYAQQIISLDSLTATLAAIGRPLGLLLVVGALALVVVTSVPALSHRRRTVLTALVALLALGEAVLVWFHWRLWDVAVVADPLSGRVTGNVAVPLWVESEKLYVWALVLGVMVLLARRHADELFPYVAVMLSLPAQLVMMVKTWVWRAPLIGRAVRAAGYLRVDRDAPNDILADAQQRLAAGIHVAVFPDPYEAYVAQLTGGSPYLTHRVRTGDSLWKIARRYGCTVKGIQTMNGIESSRIRPGQDLKIPGAH